MKTIIYKFIKALGFTLLKTKYMPSGISIERDIADTDDLTSIKTGFDVGANKGMMSLYFKGIFPEATIWSFEPISDTYDLLNANTKSFSNINRFKLGFAEIPGTVRVYLQKDHGLNSINESVNKPDPKFESKYEDIELDTINAFAQKNSIQNIDLLKTDAEGLDLKIIKGADELIKAGKIRYILAEVGFSEDNLRNTFFEELRLYLYSHGYKVRGFYDQSNFGNLPYMTCANVLFVLQGKEKNKAL
jgi:FkbM family methyltransferase